ncbi:unnamed protein product, partial [Prorocentrum cordatum]
GFYRFRCFRYGECDVPTPKSSGRPGVSGLGFSWRVSCGLASTVVSSVSAQMLGAAALSREGTALQDVRGRRSEGASWGPRAAASWESSLGADERVAGERRSTARSKVGRHSAASQCGREEAARATPDPVCKGSLWESPPFSPKDIRLYDLSDAEESDVERSGGDATYGEMSFEMVVLHHGDIADDGGPQRNGTVVLFPNRLFEDSRKKHRREHQPFGSALGHPFWPGGAPGEFSADIQEGRR